MRETNDGDLTKQVMQLLDLPDVTEQDIESSYRLGKCKQGIARDVIMKFTSKKKRDEFYSKWKSTPKDRNNKKAYINEDLTQSRSKLFYDARRLVKSQRIHSTWSQEGNIMIKVAESDTPVSITTHEELKSKVFGTSSNDIDTELSYELEYPSECDYISDSN